MTPGSTSGQPTTATSATGSIYDLGYQRYEGPRLGRRYAVGALFSHTVRGSFGIGRGGRAKVVPIGLLILALFPAIVAVGISGLASRLAGGGAGSSAQLISYERYWSLIVLVVVLFCAAQAPEIVGRDQRSGVLSLYFSRSIRRTDYALARYGGLVVAIGIVILVPQAVILIGRILAATDVGATVSGELGRILPVLGQAAIAATLLGGISLAVAAWTPRRAYATAAIIAVLIIPPVVATVISQTASRVLADYAAVISAQTILSGTNAFFYGITISGAGAGIAPGIFVLIAVVVALGTLAVLVERYRRITA